MMKEITYHVTKNKKCPYVDWLISLDKTIKFRITQRIDRLIDGNSGDWKKIGIELFELRLDFGKGYRVYYTELTQNTILILCGGDKSTQEEDITKAKKYLKEIRDNKNEA